MMGVATGRKREEVFAAWHQIVRMNPPLPLRWMEPWWFPEQGDKAEYWRRPPLSWRPEWPSAAGPLPSPGCTGAGLAGLG
jgi:hypothetical protein